MTIVGGATRHALAVPIPLEAGGTPRHMQIIGESDGLSTGRAAMARSFTREEFYDLVWSKPLTHLAKEFAISDVALHKICKKHNIPNPPLGWWAKKASGKNVAQAPLPKARTGTPEKITIANADFSRESATLAGIREQARIIASEGNDDQAAAHPIVDRTLAMLRKAKPSDKSVLVAKGAGLITCEVASSSIERLAIALPRIVKAVSLQGFELVAGKEAANFKSETEIVDFSIVEAVRREKHALTDAERSQDEAWQRKRDRAARRNSWENVFFDRPRFPEWDYHPTGQLSFELEHIYVFDGAAPRRSFRDAKVQRLENMASDIAVGLAVLAAAKTEQRLRREADQRRLEQERLRRELAARAKYIEDRRTAGLSAILTELDELDRLRRLVATINKEVPSAPAPRLAAFLIWAKEHLTKREALLSAHGIEDRFEALRLFGDDDDHAFRSSSWT